MAAATPTIPLPILARCYAGPLALLAFLAIGFLTQPELWGPAFAGISLAIAVASCVGIATAVDKMRSMRLAFCLFSNGVALIPFLLVLAMLLGD